MIANPEGARLDIFAAPTPAAWAADNARFKAFADGRFIGPAGETTCVAGKGGVIAASAKTEGDGASPLGVWPLLFILYRPDRCKAPASGLPVIPLRPHDGWCDAPDHPLYNSPIRRPFQPSHEALWREDRLYDVIVVLGHNLFPMVPGAGSAIFWHQTHPTGRPTEGCIALEPDALTAQLALAAPGDALQIL